MSARELLPWLRSSHDESVPKFGKYTMTALVDVVPKRQARDGRFMIDAGG
jgi:hypothetical protein